MPLSDVEQQLCEHIAARADELYQQIESYVAIPTGHDHVAGLDTFREQLAGRLAKLGAAVDLAAGDTRPAWMRVSRTPPVGDDPFTLPSLIAKREGKADSPRVLIACHIDTVHEPGGSFQQLERDEDDSEIARGPGAVDMKGGIVCALAALEALHQGDVPLNWTMLLTSDEETGSFMSERILREQAAVHDFGIATEPALADGSLAIERMGSGQFMIEVHGQSAHVGRAFEQGRSAVTALGRLLVKIGDMPDPGAGMIVNVGPIVGGGATNAVPDYAACWGNVRYADVGAGERLGEMIDGLSKADVGESISVKVHRHWNRPAKPLIPETEALAKRARQAAEDLGQELPIAATGGVCDGNIMQDAGLPTIDTLGIRGGNLHRTDEFIEVPAIVERAQLLAVLLSRLSEAQ